MPRAVRPDRAPRRARTAEPPSEPTRTATLGPVAVAVAGIDDEIDDGIDDDAVDGPGGGARLTLPRIQDGARPQHLLITLFADYWFGRTELLPSAALVAMAEEFGITPTSTRAALGRLSRRGLLSSTKVGRRTFYGPTPRTEGLMATAQERIFSFGQRASQPWDGSWLVVAFSVPEHERDVRHALRRRLRWLGFAPLYDGVWVSAHPVEQQARETVDACGVRQVTIFRSTAVYSTTDAGPDHHPLSAWNLDDLRAMYQGFLDRFEPVRDRITAGTVGASEALVERTAIMDTWRSFPGLDPELPASVLPDTWPLDRAHELFAEVYDTLGPLAEARLRQIVTRFEPDLAELASHYTTQTAMQVVDEAHRTAARAKPDDSSHQSS